MPALGSYALDDHRVEWAWDKLKQGYGIMEVSFALHVDVSTLRRALVRRYGKTRPRPNAKLVYNEGSITPEQRRYEMRERDEQPSYFMCGEKSLPRLLKKAEEEAAKILEEFAACYNTNGRLSIKIEPIDHELCYSVGATLMWDGEPMQEVDDPCGLLFLQLNDMMLKKMIELRAEDSKKEEAEQ